MNKWTLLKYIGSLVGFSVAIIAYLANIFDGKQLVVLFFILWGYGMQMLGTIRSGQHWTNLI